MKLKDYVDARLATGDQAILKTVKRWKTSAGDFSAFYFRSEICRKKEVPVYAVMGLPRGKASMPGVLHYHGGGQTANPNLVDLLVRQGYAAISFDWTGPSRDRPHVTHWNGCTPRFSGMVPDESRIIRALTAGRQALSVLAKQPRVDSRRLGAFGISWGGFQTWLLNAIDDRLSAAVAIYGCGITRSQAACYLHDQKKRQRFDPDAWLNLFNPPVYARHQRGPVLFLNGTNDFFGWMNTFRRLSEKLDDRHRAAFAPHLNHGIGSLNPTLLAWLDRHLRVGVFPGRPTMEIEETRRGLALSSLALPDAKSATFYVASNNGIGPELFWMPLDARRNGRFFTASVPAASIHARRVMVYVHQRFATGVEASSFPLRLTGMPIRVQKPMGRMLPMTPNFWYGAVPVDPLFSFTPLRTGKWGKAQGLEWKTGKDRGFQFNTRAIATPPFRLTANATLSCRLHPVTDPITVAVLQYAGTARERRFQGEFQRVALEQGITLSTLKDTQGRPLRPGMALSHLYIGGYTTRPGIVRLRNLFLRAVK